HHRQRAVGAGPRGAARPPRHRAVHLRRGPAGARRAAVAGHAAVDRQAVGIARGGGLARCAHGAADPRGRHLGGPAVGHDGHCTRAAVPAGGADRLSRTAMTETYVRERSTAGRKDLSYPAAPEPLTVPVYDNHCHLEITDGVEPLSLREQLDRAEAVGIAGVVQASGDIEASRWAVEAAASDHRVLAAVAIHPNDAPIYAADGRLDEAIGVIDELAAHPRTRAIGETGLDYFRTDEPGRPAQHESFE